MPERIAHTHYTFHFSFVSPKEKRNKKKSRLFSIAPRKKEALRHGAGFSPICATILRNRLLD